MREEPNRRFVMSDATQFEVKACGCGSIHMHFGSTVINLTTEVANVVAEKLYSLTHYGDEPVFDRTQEKNVLFADFLKH